VPINNLDNDVVLGNLVVRIGKKFLLLFDAYNVRANPVEEFSETNPQSDKALSLTLILEAKFIAADYRDERTVSSLWELCRRKLRHRIISSVVLCRRKPRAIRISSVVDCRRIIGACWILLGARAQGLGSLDEHEELSGDLR